MNGKKILVVDDNAIILKTLAMKLSANDYEVLTAEDGAGAVRIARQQKPDLILLDVNFPPDVAHGGGVPWDGLLIMNWLKRLGEAGNIPIIIITGSADAKLKAEALKAGAVNFFQKPVDNEKLLAAIRKILGQDHEASQPQA